MIILTVLFYGGSLVTTDVISVGNLTSFILYAAYVGIGFNGVSTFYAEMMKALGASTRLWEIIDRQPTIPVDQGLIPTKHLIGNIMFNQVDFSYPSRPDVAVIKDLSLAVPADHVMAVVGGSGSGN
jgi:ATP-binding cassette subfamily B (MDR/TAP) protein 10